MADGWEKNLERVTGEWHELKAGVLTFVEDQGRNLKRLMKPSLDQGNREHFVPHVSVAFLSTFWRFFGVVAGMERSLTYLTVLGLVGWLLWTIAGWVL